MNDTAASHIPEEDLWRAETYSLLARLLASVPDRELLNRLAAIPCGENPDDPPLARAWKRLAASARDADDIDLVEEYQTLFIGPTRGELLPYASWYLTGFLMEKPLAALRNELRSFGIERQASAKEPEDHVAALCEVMSLLIIEAEGREADFFAKHLAPWIMRFFTDLTEAQFACFYRAVGELGTAFLNVEQQYLEMAKPKSGYDKTRP
ncbi:TorD/DmsD family molecular chaperone [Methylocaldum sp.]|uniref:TorD/DmsD family molecular chaperone n=1 Tax=Methylocaldum sp. TaxID=1969727 RepID=UPI002D2C89F1|nr:molecular chaperone TorD family protein [Methylocaldum sp.]HYE36001.1 molecular chaperone TorD family protein [Methylocaldum sp.]